MPRPSVPCAKNEADHDALADLSHNTLITGGSTLQAWIDGRRADEPQRRRLEARVAERIGCSQRAASLLDPVELVEGVRWMESNAAGEPGNQAEALALRAPSRSVIESVERRGCQRTF